MQSLTVYDLNKDVTESMLTDWFSRFGQLESIRICRNSLTYRSLGSAYVKFVRQQDAEHAFHTYSTSPALSGRIKWTTDTLHTQTTIQRVDLINQIYRIIKPLHPEIAVTITHLILQLGLPEFLQLLAQPKAMEERVYEFSLIVKQVLIDLFMCSADINEMMQKLMNLNEVSFNLYQVNFSSNSVYNQEFRMIINEEEILSFFQSETTLIDKLAESKL